MKKILIFLFIFIVSTVHVLAQSPFGQDPVDPGTATNPGYVTDPGYVEGTGYIEGTGGFLNPGNIQGVGTIQSTGQGGGTPNQLDPDGPLPVVGNGLIPEATSAGGSSAVGQKQSLGQVLRPGNGGILGFWQSLMAQISSIGLSGGSNQSTEKNQQITVDPGTPDEILEFKAKAPLPEANSLSYEKRTFSCSRNTSNKTLGGYLNLAICVMVYLIPICIGILVLWFMFGSLRYINDNEHEARQQYKTFLIWAIIILFVALSFIQIVALMKKTTGL